MSMGRTNSYTESASYFVHEIGGTLVQAHQPHHQPYADGEVYRRRVAAVLERIAAARGMASDLAKDGRLTIACGGSISEMFLRPRLGDLQHGPRKDATVRLLHCEGGRLPGPPERDERGQDRPSRELPRRRRRA